MLLWPGTDGLVLLEGVGVEVGGWPVSPVVTLQHQGDMESSAPSSRARLAGPGGWGKCCLSSYLIFLGSPVQPDPGSGCLCCCGRKRITSPCFSPFLLDLEAQGLCSLGAGGGSGGMLSS